MVTDDTIKVCFCGGESLEYMGFVHRDPRVLLDEKTACACNTLCTDAAGPCCNCTCGGKNHGRHRYVQIEYVKGSVPKAVKADQRALDRAAEYLGLVEACEEKIKFKYGTFIVKMDQGIRIDYSTWSEIRSAFRTFQKAKDFKIHSRRVTELKKFLTA